MVSVAQVSNVLGTVNPIKEIVSVAHAHGVPVMVDGAQSAPHFAVDVQDLDCDFFVFSGHKMYGPTGVGVLYGKEEWLDQLPPYQGGGEMIEHVSFEKTTFEKPPLKFEAGTPDYIASHGLATAIDYMEHIGMDEIAAHERELTKYAVDRLSQIEGMTIYGHGQGVESDAIVLQIGMWATPILWDLGMIRWIYQVWFKLNPITYIVNGFRSAIYGREWFWQHFYSSTYFWILVMGMFCVGSLVFRKLKVHFADVM